ncbi:MAG: hypothetical protein CML04_10440 [Pseudozobellia sp.]|nr:hypothetical protein [Pseudozobellia sp.]MBG47073.1 hypothetical protein [Pseudozobellia sp.]|tara:strand:- start:27 stop:671 length:645 start_codon:yes stop_codon:yes gene_type:complete
MGQKFAAYRKYLPQLYKYFFEFLVVFVGVFLAFWLNNYQESKTEERKKREIYTAIYEDLNAFYESGKRENEKGFVQFFLNLDKQSDSLIGQKKIPVKTILYGDYWKVPIIKSFVQSGLLKDVDIEIFKKVTRFNTVHQNFLQTIEDYNTFYDQYITAEYDQGMEHFYQPDSNKLRGKYIYLEDALEGVAEFAELLVTIAHEVATEIQSKHLADK